MDHYVQPVVTTRPARGREMQSKIVPTVTLDTRSDRSLTLDQKKKKEKTGEVYHEGYVDGKLVMVPDSNLEAMKDLINFRMRPRRSTRFKHQTSYDLSDYDHFQGKLGQLLEKIDNIQPIFSQNGSLSEQSDKKTSILSDGTISTMTTSSRSEVSPDEKDIYHDNSIESDENIEPEKELEGELEGFQKPVMSEPMEPDIKQIPEPEPDEYRLRFLISGHITNDEKPVYIIQQYEGESNIFDGQKADFASYTEENNHNVFISGKFYNENILEESQGKPVALNLKTNKILINEETSKLYKNEFKNVFSFEDVDVLLKGEFIQTGSTKNITPLLTLGITHKRSETSKTGAQEKSNDHDNSYMFNNQTPINVFNYGSKGRNPFSYNNIPDNSLSHNSQSFSDPSIQQSESIEKNSHFQTYILTTESSQLDSSPQSRSLDEEPTIYEYPKSHDLKKFKEKKNDSVTEKPIKSKNGSKYKIINTPENSSYRIDKLVENYKNKEVENKKIYKNSQASTRKYDNSKRIVKATPLKKGTNFQTNKVNSYFKLFSKKNRYANSEKNPSNQQTPCKNEFKLSTKQQLLNFDQKIKGNQFGKCVKHHLANQTKNPKVEKRNVKPSRYRNTVTSKHSLEPRQMIVEHPYTNREETFPTETGQNEDTKSTQFITYI